MNMSKELKKDWLPKLQQRYARRNREGKTRMIDELCADYHYERKYAIKLLSGRLPAAGGNRCFWILLSVVWNRWPKSLVVANRPRYCAGDGMVFGGAGEVGEAGASVDGRRLMLIW